MGIPPSKPRPARLPGRVRLLIGGIWFLVFAGACALPGIGLDNGEHWPGIQLFVMGPLGLLLGHTAWLANLVGFVAFVLLCFGRRWGVVISSVLAVCVGLAMLELPGKIIPLDEANVKKARIVSLDAGAWLWLGSLLLPGAAALVVRPRRDGWEDVIQPPPA